MAKTFSNFDKFGLEQFADKLRTYLQVESKFVDESFVLSLNSEFGSGKSTFFEMWADKLKASNDTFEVVYINAWESDFQGDPLLAIVSHLLDIKQASKNTEPIKETTGKLCKFALSIGNDVVQKVTGVNFIKAGQYAEPEDGTAELELGHACFQLYQERHELFEKLKVDLHSLTEESELPILVIIDELDRCRPNYAIEFLETIKHLFDISGLVFVIGVDKNQLASSAKALFGQDIIFDEYYRKFAHRNVNLPVKSHDMTKQFCRKLVGEYLSREAYERKKRFSYAKYDAHCTDKIVDLCMAFSLNARQMHEFFRITSHVLSITEESKTNILWGWQVGTFFMVALSIKHRDFYDQIGSEKIALSEFTAFLKKLILFNKGELDSFWWASLLYLGLFNGLSYEKLEQEFQKLGIWDSSGKEATAFKNELSRFGRAFSNIGRFRDEDQVFPKIYQTLEDLRTFAS